MESMEKVSDGNSCINAVLAGSELLLERYKYFTRKYRMGFILVAV